MRRIAALLSLVSLTVGGLSATASGSLANDASGSPEAIASLPFTRAFLASDATTEPGEPQPEGCAAISNSAWFAYTADDTEDVVVTTYGSSANTTLAVYADAPGGELLACSDDPADGALIAEASAQIPAGVTAVIQVGTSGTTSGEILLTVESLAKPPAACVGEDCLSFRAYPAPGLLGKGAGELNIGINPKTDAAMVLTLNRTLRVTWDEEGNDEWRDVTGLLLKDTNDPILWTDQVTGRTFIAQLRAYVGSIMGYTDDDGETWQITQPATVEPSWDHQSVGGGPYPLGFENPLYDRAMYYCAQTGLAANQCARSDNGGLSWGAPLPMQVGACGGLHGHIAVSPRTGAVVVPHKSCNGRQGVVVSETAGTTWRTTRLAGTLSSRSDPAVAYDAAGRLYFIGESGGAPVVATSDDDGVTWTTPMDLGAAYGIRNTTFSMAVAGDAGRAAVAWYGTPRGGSDQAGGFAGVWHVYVSVTTDGGATWTTTDATPTDPIQRGCIWMGGGGNACRNLLDFQGMDIDSQGRVVIAAADGCVDFVGCADPHGQPKDSRHSYTLLLRQDSGPRLRAPS
ncbi:MAG: sialidase family protein [Actinomycetota bacterium]